MTKLPSEPGPATQGTAVPDPADISGGELADKMGITMVEVSAERVIATMPVDGNRQPFGLLHGGASAVLAESVGSIHAALLAGFDRTTVGIEISCSHHRAARSGIVTAVSTPLHSGRTVSTFHIALTDDHGRPTCTARLTCMTRPAAGADG